MPAMAVRRFAERPLVFKISPLALEHRARIYSYRAPQTKVTFDISTITTHLLRRLATKEETVISPCIVYFPVVVLYGRWQVWFIMQVRTHRSLRRRKRDLT